MNPWPDGLTDTDERSIRKTKTAPRRAAVIAAIRSNIDCIARSYREGASGEIRDRSARAEIRCLLAAVDRIGGKK